LSFAPASCDFENELENIVSGFVDTVSGDESSRLLNHEDLEQYTELYKSETDPADVITVTDIIAHDEVYSLHVSDLKHSIYNAFSVCHDYLQSFESFKEMTFHGDYGHRYREIG
jgi:hypothetical protein